eukprot:GHVQ01040152.1.p1 GENE.GHVQ01040152.1~~GHVQ01040152.1.p1  ORF type:complete len:321 (+),score=51.28 GHVQ01040152.1:281-1243(+)
MKKNSHKSMPYKTGRPASSANTSSPFSFSSSRLSSGRGEGGGGERDGGGAGYVSQTTPVKVVMPVNIPFGTILVDNRRMDKPKHFFAFDDEYPSAKALFTNHLSVCDVFASHLEIELMHIGCRVENVGKVADVFNKMAPQVIDNMDGPLRMRGWGLRSRPQMWNTSLPDVIEVPCDSVTPEDRARLMHLEHFKKELADKLQEEGLVTNLHFLCDANTMAIAVRKFEAEPLPYGLEYYKQFVVEDLQLFEIKIIDIKPSWESSGLDLDPRFSDHGIVSRSVIRDSKGKLARYVFADGRVSEVVKKSAHFAARNRAKYIALD